MKTRNKAHHAVSYAYQAGEPILIDANVWLYLHPPAAQPAPAWASDYSGAYASLLNAQARPQVDTVILSEYFNRYIRIEYDAAWRATYPSFKRFRQSSHGQPILQSAAAEMEQILGSCIAVDTSLSSIDLPALMCAVRDGAIDFNDGVLIENCRIRGCKLLTHDADMNIGGIEVLTTNKKLMAACP